MYVSERAQPAPPQSNTPTVLAWLAFLTSLCTLIAAGGGAYMAFQANDNAVKTSEGIHEVHLSVNSRLDEFRELMEKEAFARGVREGEANTETEGEELP